MLFPGIRIRVDQDEENEVKRRGGEATAMRWSEGLKQMCHNFFRNKNKNETEESGREGEKDVPKSKITV